MATKLVMPKFGLTMEKGSIVNWLKAEGDTVKAGDGVLEIETEKLSNVIESPVDGTILKVFGEAGESFQIAAVLAYIGEPGEAVPETGEEEAERADGAEGAEGADAPREGIDAERGGSDAPREGIDAERGGGRVIASPAARALARSLGIDYSGLTGTGPGGRIVRKDVGDAAESTRDTGPVQVIPYTGMRESIGEGMFKSWSTAPMVTHHVKADVTELLSLREQLNAGASEGEQKIGMTDLYVTIVSRAIRDFPIIGATLKDGGIHVPACVNIGVAVALEKGLLVPVVKNAESKGLYTISVEVADLVKKAKSGQLVHDDVSGGTFTVSNIGGFGSVDFFTPIINHPESAILGIGRAIQEPAVRDGRILIRTMAGLSLTFDHRVIDGAPAAEFLSSLLRRIEHPGIALFLE